MKMIRRIAVTLAAIVAAAGIAGCAPTMDAELAAHLEAESDFARHQYHVQKSSETGYDPEHVDDCYYYEEELHCEFE
jgi:hypothetical protein